MNHTPQVTKEHYAGAAYRSSDRWMSYFYQLGLVEKVGARNILEVGVGSGVLARELEARGIQVTTLDIAEDLQPDIVASVIAIPREDSSFDASVAFEVLEHMPFEESVQALRELMRVSRTHVLVSLPHPGWVFSVIYKLPLFPRIEILFQIPFFWRTHKFNGEHYWELGTKGYSIRRFVDTARACGLSLVSIQKHANDPAHRFFVFKKTV
ncbi:class I SAM-dependent methyltransferase [Patescibacteria group bacterium]|nr:class I SAM-dependent methyltransferase [Patescibacteria group bacterium]